MSWNQIIQSLLFDVLNIPVGTWRYICKFKNPLQSLVWIYLHIPMWPILFFHTACGRSSWTFCEWIGFRKWSGKLDLIQINLFLNYFLLYPSNSMKFLNLNCISHNFIRPLTTKCEENQRPILQHTTWRTRRHHDLPDKGRRQQTPERERVCIIELLCELMDEGPTSVL